MQTGALADLGIAMGADTNRWGPSTKCADVGVSALGLRYSGLHCGTLLEPGS